MANNKQRLFEVMHKVNPDFKPKLNEELLTVSNSESVNEDFTNSYDEIINSFPGHARQTNSIDSSQYKWFVNVLNFISSNNNDINQKAELIKFFQNNFLGLDYGDFNSNEELINWWLSPEQQEFIKGELNSQEGQINEINIINPKYTHFAVMKDNNDIVNGWDYRDIEPVELRNFKKDYFFNDITNMGIDPHSVNIVTANYLKSSGINPFDTNNWKRDANVNENINENQEGFKRLIVFSIYDKNNDYLGDLDPMDEENNYHIQMKSDVMATPEFQKFAKEKNITPEQIGKISKDYEYTMDGNPLSTEYYAPSESEELYDEKTKTFYNNSGQQMRDSSEYDSSGEGYTPFGDEGY